MNKFTRTLTATAVSAVIGLSLLGGASAEDVAVEITNDGIVSVAITGGDTFADVAYSASASTSAGSLVFTSTDTRALKATVWSASASVTGFTGTPAGSFDADIDLTLLAAGGGSDTVLDAGVTADASNISSTPDVDDVVLASDGTTTVTSANQIAEYTATVQIPAAQAPAAYVATVTVDVTGGGNL